MKKRYNLAEVIDGSYKSSPKLGRYLVLTFEQDMVVVDLLAWCQIDFMVSRKNNSVRHVKACLGVVEKFNKGNVTAGRY